MRIINVVIYLINDVIWCVSQYILSKFHYNTCRKGKEIIIIVKTFDVWPLVAEIRGGGIDMRAIWKGVSFQLRVHGGGGGIAPPP